LLADGPPAPSLKYIVFRLQKETLKSTCLKVNIFLFAAAVRAASTRAAAT